MSDHLPMADSAVEDRNDTVLSRLVPVEAATPRLPPRRPIPTSP